ncbi:MAG TPA: alpha/beta hydrolase [Patescibacteria group bacterium]|nr:alpha/beta hydrolase [Patescibacteria group bacterium]
MGYLDKLWHKTLRRPYNLAYIEQGQGRPVVLLHGLGASKSIWRPLTRLLPADKWHVIVPDLLGFGDSPRPDWNSYDITQHARMVAAFLKNQHIIGPITLVGHSMGCLVATHIAAANPQLVKDLILYEPPLLDELPEFPSYTKRSTRYKALFTYIAEHPQLAYLESRVLWRAARKISCLDMSEEAWLPFERSLRNTILNQQAYRELQSIPIRTDIVYGRLDFIVIRQGIKDLFKHNTNIKLHLVTDVHGISTRSAKYLANLIEKTVKHHKHS